MRVLLIGEFGVGSLGRYYSHAFAELGIEVGTYSLPLAPTSGRSKLSTRILRRGLRGLIWRRAEAACLASLDRPWDFVLALKAPFLSKRTVAKMRERCENTLMLYPDSPWDQYTMRRDVVSVLSMFRTTFIWSHALVSQLRSHGVNSEYLAFAHDPRDYRPPDPGTDPKPSALVFVGQVYERRIAWLRALEGLAVRVSGTGWKQALFGEKSTIRVDPRHYSGPAARDAYVSSAAALNILDHKNLSGHNMRTFEIPGTRTLMIGDSTADIEHFFPNREASLTASTPEEFRAQCEWALSHPELSNAIAAEGYSRVLGQTYTHRAQEIISYVTR